MVRFDWSYQDCYNQSNRRRASDPSRFFYPPMMALPMGSDGWN